MTSGLVFTTKLGPPTARVLSLNVLGKASFIVSNSYVFTADGRAFLGLYYYILFRWSN